MPSFLSVIKGSGCYSDVRSDFDDSRDGIEVTLRCLFDRVLSISWNGACNRGCIRPLPALLGDGQSLDLFKLFRAVRKRAGLDSSNGFWISVAKELGLDHGFSVPVKLVYFKYLYNVEKWLSRSSTEGMSGNGELELKTKFRYLLSRECDRERKGGAFALPENKNDGKYIDVGVRKSEIGLLDTKNVRRECGDVVGKRHRDDDKRIHDNNERIQNGDGDDLAMLDPRACKQEYSSRKRKRESLSRMLKWVIQIAKFLSNPSTGEILQFYKWEDERGNDVRDQAIRARDALLRRKWDDSNLAQSPFQNNGKIYPYMYDNVSLPCDHSTERFRCREQVPALVKNCLCSFRESCSLSQNKKICSPKKELESSSPSKDEHQRIHVLLGPLFQAEVPSWSGIVFESDSKWLGTGVWPEKYEDHSSYIDPILMGNGRPDVCDCKLSGSVDCVRFHIAEERLKLKLEIGPAFYRWRFHHMGEEVSLRWTDEEEKRFEDMVRFNPSSPKKCFWDYAYKYFPGKTKGGLVSYYFNVYLVRRRSYQNRVTPENINSDDDELNFG